MKVVPRVVLAMLLTVGAAASAPATVVACSCAQASEKEHFAAADLVIEGLVSRSDHPFGGFMVSSADPITYTVAIDKVLKGEAGGEVEVRTARDEASCGVSLAIGQRWRVYAHRDADGLYVNLCSGNELLDQQPQTADEPPDQDQPGPMGAMWMLVSAVFGGVAALLALIALRQVGRS